MMVPIAEIKPGFYSQKLGLRHGNQKPNASAEESGVCFHPWSHHRYHIQQVPMNPHFIFYQNALVESKQKEKSPIVMGHNPSTISKCTDQIIINGLSTGMTIQGDPMFLLKIQHTCISINYNQMKPSPYSIQIVSMFHHSFINTTPISRCKYDQQKMKNKNKSNQITHPYLTLRQPLLIFIMKNIRFGCMLSSKATKIMRLQSFCGSIW